MSPTKGWITFGEKRLAAFLRTSVKLLSKVISVQLRVVWLTLVVKGVT